MNIKEKYNMNDLIEDIEFDDHVTKLTKEVQEYEERFGEVDIDDIEPIKLSEQDLKIINEVDHNKYLDKLVILTEEEIRTLWDDEDIDHPLQNE